MCYFVHWHKFFKNVLEAVWATCNKKNIPFLFYIHKFTQFMATHMTVSYVFGVILACERALIGIRRLISCGFATLAAAPMRGCLQAKAVYINNL